MYIFFIDVVPYYFQAPQQKNGYDCGVFTLRSLDVVLDRCPPCISTLNVESFFTEVFAGAFTQEDVTEHRTVTIPKLIER